MSDEVHKMECLARYMMDLTLEDRRSMLRRMTKRHGQVYADKLKDYLNAEAEKRRRDKEEKAARLAEARKTAARKAAETRRARAPRRQGYLK